MQDVPPATLEEAGRASERTKLEREVAQAGEALEDISDAKDEELTTSSAVVLDDGDCGSTSEEDPGVRVLMSFKVNEMCSVAVLTVPLDVCSYHHARRCVHSSCLTLSIAISFRGGVRATVTPHRTWTGPTCACNCISTHTSPGDDTDSSLTVV